MLISEGKKEIIPRKVKPNVNPLVLISENKKKGKFPKK